MKKIYTLCAFALFVTGLLGVAYFGIFSDSIRSIDSCSIVARHYYLAPLLFKDRFAYGDYRDPRYQPSIPLMTCLCHANDESGYEKLVGVTTTAQIFEEVCKAPPGPPYDVETFTQ